MLGRTTARAATPRSALAATVLLSLVVYSALARGASVPRFFMDELYYMRAGVSFARGDGLAFEGDAWGYGPLFPLIVGGIVRATPGQEQAYELVKLVNALCFSLAAIPVAALARRVLLPWPSVAVAVLSAAIPSSMYVSVVMTESVGYLLACCALYLGLRALECPSAGWQLGALGAMLLAVLTRPQLVAVYIGYLVGLAVVVAVVPAVRARMRASPWALWPTALSVVAGVGWLARPLTRGDDVGAAFGAYSVLLRGYDPLKVAKWFGFHLGELALYLAVVPVVVAPVVLVLLWQRARGGSARHGGFLALLVTQTTVGVGVVAAFASTEEFGQGLLYDRYLFYLVPMWLVVVFLWLHEGQPRPWTPLAIGATAAVLLVATLPFGVIGHDDWFRQFQSVALESWGKVGLVTAKIPFVTTRLVAVVLVAAVVALVVLGARRRAWVVAAAIATVLAANLAGAWRSAYVPAESYGLAAPGKRSWVDDAVGERTNVAMLNVARRCRSQETFYASLETRFFNRSVTRAFALPGSGASADAQLRVRPDGALVDSTGAVLVAPFVVTAPDVELRGRRLATGTLVGLVLWKPDGGVRIVKPRSTAVDHASCAA